MGSAIIRPRRRWERIDFVRLTLRQVDDLPDNIDAVQEAAEAVLRRSSLPDDVVEFLVRRHRRNRISPTTVYRIWVVVLTSKKLSSPAIIMYGAALDAVLPSDPTYASA